MPSMNEDLSKIRRIMAAGLPAVEQTWQSNRVPSFFTAASGGKLSGSVHPTVRPTVQTARQRMLYQGEETTTKWYKNDTPTSSEMLARIYEQYGNNREEGQKALDLFEQARRDPTSPIYNPYVDATNSAVASMAGLGYDMRGGVTKDWLEQNRALVGSYRTGSSGTPLAPSSQSTPENDAAYWYYKILSAEPETENAETEWEALQEEVRYWTGRADRNYSDEEILAKINWADYPTLVRMDEGRKKGTPLALNRPVGYSQDALYGVIWAARNNSTGDPLVDSVKAVLGQGNMWREDAALSARLDPTSAEYSPYSAGSTLDDAALYFGVSEFSSDWLDRNRSYLGGNDATAKQMYQKVYDAEQTTLQAEEELNSLWDSVDEWMKYSSDPDVILSGLLDDCPTLRKMDESRKSGKLIATTRAVDYRWEDVEAEVRRRCEQVNTATQGGMYTEQVGDTLGVPLPHAESDIALEKSRDNAINAGAGTIMDQGTEEEKSVFQTAYSSNFGDYLLEINRAINEGVTDPQGGYAYCLERADSYAAENYLDAKAVVAPYESMQQSVQAAQAELDTIKGQLWVQQDLHSGDENADQAGAPLQDRYHTTAVVDGSSWELYAERVEGTTQYRFTGAYNVDTGEFLDPIPGAMGTSLTAKGELFAQSIGSEGETTERKDFTPEEQTAIADRVKELEGIITSGNAYLQTNAGAYENSRRMMQQIDDGYAVANRMADLADVEKGNASATRAALDFVYAFGAEYKPTQWMAEDLYTAALQEGNSYDQVARAAQMGSQANRDAISQIDYALDWIESSGAVVDQRYLDNMMRERARLERETKAAEYFLLQGNADFDSVVAGAMANVDRPAFSLSLSTDWSDSDLAYYAAQLVGDKPLTDRPPTGMSLMTDQERKTFLYLYGKEGADAAREYYDYMTDPTYGVVEVRNAQLTDTVSSDLARNMPVASSILSVIASPMQIAGTVYSVGAAINGREINPYNNAFGPTQMVGGIRGTVKEGITAALGEGSVGSFLANLGYDAVTAAGDSLVNSYLVGGLAGIGGGEAASGLSAISRNLLAASPMGVQAAGSAIRDAKLRGADDTQALMMGGATFLAETLSEAITVGNIRAAFKKGETAEAAKGFLRALLKDGLEEGIGETASEFLSAVSDEAIMGTLSNRRAVEQEYITNGMDPETALWQSWKDAAKEMLYAGLTGFVSSGVSTGAGYAAGALNRSTGESTLPANEGSKGTPVDAESTTLGEADFPFMTNTFSPDAIETENAAQQNGILSRQMAALTMATTTTDEASVTATIGAVLQQSSDGSNSMAGVAAQHMVSRLGAVKAATVTQNVLLTAAENGIPVEQAQSALAVAALASGQAQQVLGEIADNNAMSPESIAMLTSAAEADMQDPAIMQQVEQTVTNNRVATRVASIVADGGLEGIVSYEMALGQARQNRDNAQAALEQARRQQTVAAENLQSAYAQFSADPGNQTMRGAVQQAIKDAEGAAKVVAEYEQSLSNAETAMQGAKTTLDQMRDSTMRRIRQQAQEEVLAEDQRVAQRKESLRMNAEAAASHIEANIRKVAEMEPVAKLKGDEFTMGEGLRAQVTDYFRSIGTVVNPEIGEISLTRRGIKSSFAHGMTRAKAAAFAAVPAVLENGKVIDAQSNWKGRNYDTFVIAAPVSIGDMKDGMCAAIVSRNSNGQQYYLHEVRFLDTEKGGFASGISATDTEPGTSETEKQTHPIDSIIDRVLQVKREKTDKGEFSASPDAVSAKTNEEARPSDSAQYQTEDVRQQDGATQNSNLRFARSTPQQQQRDVSAAPKGAPKQSPARIATDLAKTLGLGGAVGTRRMNSVPQAVQGFYDTRARYIAVRSSQAGNYTVTMHEVFHHLADRLGMTGTQDMVNNLDPVFAASYEPAALPGEAFAEFGWRYMESETLARQFAGDAFVDQFEARLRQAGLQKTVHNAARQLRIWLNATVNDRIGATIVDKNKATKPGSIRAQLRAMISQHIDDTAAAEPVNASIRKESGNNIPLNQDVRANALMKNFASRRAYAILTENLTDANWNVTGKSLASRFERVGLKAKDAELLNEYMLALHSLDRDAQGKPVFDTVGVPADQRQRLIDDVQQNHPEVAAAEKEFQAFRKEFLRAFLVDTGYLSQADFDKMNAMYPHYVPTYRVKNGGRRGGSSKTYRIRRASGSTEDIINPMDSFVSMVDSVVTMVSANNAALAWDSAYRQNEGLGAFGREITPDMHQVSVDVSRLQNQIAQLLSGNTDADVFQQVIDLIGTRQIQWVPQSAANMANVITVQRSDGSVGYYEMFDPELYKLLSSQRDGSGSSNKLWSTLGKVTRAMSMLTTGSNPVFVVRNFMRDFQNSVNYGSWASNYGSGFMKWVRAAHDIWTKSGEYQDYVALGGGGWTRIEAGTKKGANAYRSALYKGYNTSSMANAVKWAGQKVWDTVTLSRLNEVIEQTSRFAEYRYGKHDKSTSEGKMEAFLAAQDVTVDFARMGNSGTASVLKQLVPFLGASTQGVYRTGRSLTEAERGRAPQRFAKTVINTALASAISAAIMLKFSDDEEKEAFAMMSDDLKAQHLYFPNFAKDVLGQQPLIRIPLAQDPLTYAIHGAVTDAIWNGTTDEMVIDVAAIANTVVDNLNPFGNGTIFEPLLAVTRNKNWYGSRIVPSYMGDWDASTQYTEETPGLFVAAGRALNMSPLNIQYLAEQYTGFLGQMVIPAISKTNSGELGGLEATIAAVQKRFTSDPLISNDVVGSVYDNAAFLTQVTDAAKNNRPANMLRRGLSEDERKAAYQEAYDLTRKGGIIADAKTFLSDGYDRIDEINANDTLTPGQKYTLTSDVRREMIEVALEANEAAAAYNEKYVAGLNIATNALYEGAYLTIPTAMDKLDQVFKADSDQMYMQRATEVWEATGNDAALPHPNTSYTSKGVTYEVGVEDMENWMAQYKMGYQDYLVRKGARWDAMSDEEKLELLKSAHSAGHDAARKWHMKLHGIR